MRLYMYSFNPKCSDNMMKVINTLRAVCITDNAICQGYICTCSVLLIILHSSLDMIFSVKTLIKGENCFLKCVGLSKSYLPLPFFFIMYPFLMCNIYILYVFFNKSSLILYFTTVW